MMSETRKLIIAHRKVRDLVEGKSDADLAGLLAADLGLESANDYAVKVVTTQFKSRVARDGLDGAFRDIRRGTGRTTQIVLLGLVYVIRGYYVTFQAYTNETKEAMYSMARRYAETLGLDLGLLCEQRPRDETGNTKGYVFTDHQDDPWR